MSINGSLGGAYDLSAFQKQTPTNDGLVGETGADGGGATVVPGPYVVELTSKNLQGAITTSSKLPVIVAFHSARSENSAKLITQLERLAIANQGRFQLAKVDTDENADVAQAFGTDAVPSAAALLQGQPVPLFQGLPDEAQLTETIEKILQAGEQYGLNAVLDGDANATPPEPEIPPLHKEGLEALENGDLEAAHAAYTKAISQNPGDDEAQTALHQVELLQRIAKINPDGDPEAPQKVLLAAHDAPITDLEAQLRAADVEFSFQRPDAAFARLIDVVRATSGDDREAARQRLIAYFDILGPSQDIVVAARKALTNALF
ncbi:co-chaperone YbbN [Trueperella sp.]|uniref:co-chaperone YbbN n=1 Tax=Trueperella sp. TaxID=2699835 RepID=UPI0037358F50